MHISPLDWQSLTIEYPFREPEQAVGFFDFQEKAVQALEQFTLSDNGSLLLLKSEVLPEVFLELENYFKAHNIEPRIEIDFNYESLFGYSVYLEKEQRVETVEGILQQAQRGVVILNLNALLADLSQWDKLKYALLYGKYSPHKVNAIPLKLADIFVNFKLILVGSREDIGAFINYDESLFQFSQYSEIDNYVLLDNQSALKWGEYVHSLSSEQGKYMLSQNAMNQLLQYFIRESENKELVTILPSVLKKHIKQIYTFYKTPQTVDSLKDYFTFLEKQSATIREYTLRDILSNQVYIETQGSIIGQINGLSVVEFEGVPYSFGEPLRITCNIQYGEGEIHDIERKVELGGNVHSKGIMIAQSCLANLLELPAQLPFSATLAFEQSYSEIDGDSSSLAIFCALISALSKLPLPQSLAVTGAIDQFGNVLSVGGVNQKIEGFFEICHARGLTGEQGVIIPVVCLSQLSLKSEVIEAVRAGKFTIWAVSDVFEAVWLLFMHYFYTEDMPDQTEKVSIFELVHQYISQSENAAASGSFWHKICKKLKWH